jgi:hypothetical protein
MSGCAASHCLGGMLIQHVDHGVAFQVHHDGAVGPSFALGPLVDANHPCLCRGGLGALLEPAQEGVVADGQPDTRRQSFAGPASERVPDQPRDDIRPTRAAPAELRDARQAVGEQPHGTRPGAAPPPTHANLE